MAPIGQLAAFGWGCAGSIAIEVVLFCDAVRGSKAAQVPALYRKTSFLVGRSLLVLVAGVLVSAWGISKPIEGMAIGAATPQVILALRQVREIRQNETN